MPSAFKPFIPSVWCTIGKCFRYSSRLLINVISLITGIIILYAGCFTLGPFIFDFKCVSPLQVADILVYKNDHNNTVSRFVRALSKCVFDYLDVCPDDVFVSRVQVESDVGFFHYFFCVIHFCLNNNSFNDVRCLIPTSAL